MDEVTTADLEAALLERGEPMHINALRHVDRLASQKMPRLVQQRRVVYLQRGIYVHPDHHLRPDISVQEDARGRWRWTCRIEVCRGRRGRTSMPERWQARKGARQHASVAHGLRLDSGQICEERYRVEDP